MSKYYLINPDFLVNAKKIIDSWTLEEKAIHYSLIEKELDQVKKMIREQLLSGSSKDIEVVVNGIPKIIKIIKGSEKITTEKRKEIDYEKAINFAKEHNLYIPMTERIVIEPEVNISLLEGQEWFQQNIEQFVNVKEEVRKTKSNDRILIVDKKG